MIGPEKKKRSETKSNWQHFVDGVLIGLGWAVGVTIGFVIISTVLIIVLDKVGGLPLVGNWIANIVEATQAQLLKRTPLLR